MDKYETFLLRKIRSEKSIREQIKIADKLEEYYTFIGCFDLAPIATEEAEDDSFMEKYSDLYTSITNKLTKSQMNKAKSDILNILKRNTKRNIEDLNNKMMDLLRVDQDFKDLIVEKLKMRTM